MREAELRAALAVKMKFELMRKRQGSGGFLRRQKSVSVAGAVDTPNAPRGPKWGIHAPALRCPANGLLAPFLHRFVGDYCKTRSAGSRPVIQPASAKLV